MGEKANNEGRPLNQVNHKGKRKRTTALDDNEVESKKCAKYVDIVDLTGDNDPSNTKAYQTPPPSSLAGATHSSSINNRGAHSSAERDQWLSEDISDVNEIIASSQDAAAGLDQLHLYGELSTKVVGVRFYNGHANPGECVLIRREPGNPYDRYVRESSGCYIISNAKCQ